MTKICTVCKKLKSLRSFKKDFRMKDGYANTCKECLSIQQAKQYKDNPSIARDRIRKYKDTNPHRAKASSTLSSHRSRGFIVNITLDECAALFENSKTCPICGKILRKTLEQTSTHGAYHDSASLDRINNEKILNNDNVWIICYECNIMKGEKSMKEFIECCDNIVKRAKEE